MSDRSAGVAVGMGVSRLAQAALLAWSLAGAAAAAGPQVRVETLAGQQLAGALSSLSGDAVTIETADGSQKLATSAVLSVAPAEAGKAPAARPSLIAELTDGSRVSGTSYQAQQGTARFVLPDGSKLSLPTAALRWVRFQAQAGEQDKLAAQWQQVVAGKAAGDVLVVRKQGALDYLEGVLGAVDDETVAFELDKQSIPVKRPKVEGLIYYHARRAELPDAVAEALDRSGSRWQIKSLALDGDALSITTPAGVTTTRPLEGLVRVDFSSANTRYLSDLEPESFQYVPYFAAREDLPVLNEAYQLRRNAGFEHGPLKLDGKTYAKGLSLHSRSTLAYRLPARFQRLKAIAGIDDGVRDGGDVKLEIRGDGKILWTGSVRGTEAAQSLDVELGGARQLEIVVDYGADFDAADVLDLCDARITK